MLSFDPAARTPMASMTLAEIIVALREERGWSQSELARRAKVGKSVLSKIERGERIGMHHRTARKLADALGVDVRALDPSAPRGATGLVVRETNHAYDDWTAVDMSELLRLYIRSEWYTVDAPTPEEMRYLEGLHLPHRGTELDAGAVHAVLMSYRKAKAK